MKKILQTLFAIVFLTAILSMESKAQNNALHFDSDARITGLSGISPAQFTIEFWMKSQHSNPDVLRYQGIYWQNSGNEYGIYMDNYEQDYGTQTLSIFPSSLNTTSFMAWTASTPDGDISQAQQSTWRHYAITSNGSEIKFYYDGTLIRTAAHTNAALPLSNVTIGGTYGIGGYTLDELRIWNFAKTQTQIQNQKDIEVPVPSVGLVRYYNFNQGVGGANNTGVTSLIERVGGNTNGTLANFSLNGTTSNWVGGAPVGNVLSVKLVSFTVKANDQGAMLAWTTTDEKDNDKFLIYRGANSNDLVQIAEIAGNGSDYSFYDKNPLAGVNYYKLVEVDKDGTRTELGIKPINFNLSVQDVKVYPNPTTDVVNVKFLAGKYNRLALTNINGSVVHQQNIDLISNECTINAKEFASGTYTLTLFGAEGKSATKIIKN